MRKYTTKRLLNKLGKKKQLQQQQENLTNILY
jgi:hypothetical protein